MTPALIIVAIIVIFFTMAMYDAKQYIKATLGLLICIGAIVGAGYNYEHKEQQALSPPVRDTLRMRDYQIDITSEESYIYDGDRLVGKFQLGHGTLEQLIEIDNQ